MKETIAELKARREYYSLCGDEGAEEVARADFLIDQMTAANKPDEVCWACGDVNVGWQWYCPTCGAHLEGEHETD